MSFEDVMVILLEEDGVFRFYAVAISNRWSLYASCLPSIAITHVAHMYFSGMALVYFVLVMNNELCPLSCKPCGEYCPPVWEEL